MEQWKKDARKEPVVIDLDTLVPDGHLLRKIEKVMDYECDIRITEVWPQLRDGAG